MIGAMAGTTTRAVGLTLNLTMNAKQITVAVIVAVLAVGAGIWLRGYSDVKGWTSGL